MKSSSNAISSLDEKNNEKHSSKEKIRERSREKEIESEKKREIIKINKLRENMKQINNIGNFYSLESSIEKYDNDNLTYLEKNINNEEYKKIYEIIQQNIKQTPKEEQANYTNLIIEIINKIQKTDEYAEFPELPYGKSLNDTEFVELLKKCVFYANYHLDTITLETIKNRLMTNHISTLKNLFKNGQVLKDLFQNALITILTTDDKDDQEDNFNLLKTHCSTNTPFIELDFNNDNKLNKAELIDTFSSYIYINNYKKTLKDYIPDFSKIVKTDKKLKEIIKNYIENHYIYFCQLPENIMALTIHSGNIYIKANYLQEYYNEKNDNEQIIIREKIILNLGHELNHTLIREISEEMKNNFLIKSNHKNKKNKIMTDITGTKIEFKNKFENKYHYLNLCESGNLFDYNFFNHYYFDELYEKEALLFKDIKNIKSFKNYREKLSEIIEEEKSIKLIKSPVNKFKKLEKEKPRICIRSRILGTKLVTAEEYNKRLEFYDDSDEDFE